MTSTYEKIATTTLGSDTASITFSSITGTYTDLVISLVAGQSATLNDAFQVRFNGDSGTNYSDTIMFGDGTNDDSARQSTVNSYRDFGDLGGTAITSQFIFNFMNYSNTTTYKTILTRFDSLQKSRTMANVGLWRNTAAITSIEFSFTGSDQFKAGTTATVYGILKA
jgi:hypothetical protein